MACRALVLTNSSRVRRKAMSDCQRARTTFEKAKAELEVFEAHDKPAYIRWYRMEFGPAIEELRACVDETNALRERIMRLARFAELSGCHPSEAAALYNQSAEAFARREEELLELTCKEEERYRAQCRKDALRDISDFLNANRSNIRRYLKNGARKSALMHELLMMMEMEFGAPEALLRGILLEPEGARLLKSVGLEGALDEEDDTGDATGDGGLPANDADLFSDPASPATAPPKAVPDHREARIKSLFRELAFALHPDQSTAGHDPARLDLWHQVQDAMAARDLDRLEVLHGHVQLMHGELSAHTPVSRLAALTRMYREARESLRRKIRELRQQREWGFASIDPGALLGLRSIVARELDTQLQAIQAMYRLTFSPGSTRRSRAPTPGQFNFADWR